MVEAKDLGRGTLYRDEAVVAVGCENSPDTRAG